MTKSDFKRIFMHSFRLYFAPLVGAVRAVRDEIKRHEHERT